MPPQTIPSHVPNAHLAGLRHPGESVRATLPRRPASDRPKREETTTHSTRQLPRPVSEGRNASGISVALDQGEMATNGRVIRTAVLPTGASLGDTSMPCRSSVHIVA